MRWSPDTESKDKVLVDFTMCHSQKQEVKAQLLECCSGTTQTSKRPYKPLGLFSLLKQGSQLWVGISNSLFSNYLKVIQDLEVLPQQIGISCV